MGLMTLSFAGQAQYNEAMCILLKQQINQYSNNQSSRNYRNAARDYKNNCDKPQPVAVSADDVLEEQHSPTNKITPEPINPDVTQASSEAISELPTEVVPEPEAVIQPEEVHNTDNTQHLSAQSEATDNIAVEPIPAQPEDTTATVTATEPAKASNNQKTSFLIPSLFLLLTLLFAGAILSRLRKKNKLSNDEQISHGVLQEQAKHLAAKASAQKPLQTFLNETTTSAEVIKDDASIKEPVVDDPDITEQENTKQENISAEEPEIDYPVFEPHPLVEQPIESEIASDSEPEPDTELTENDNPHGYVRNQHQFDEPEIRTYDPDAPLPGQKGYTQSAAVKARFAASPNETLADDITTTSLKDSKAIDDNLNINILASQDAEKTNSQGNAFEADAPDTESLESQPKHGQPDSANPFANLSLDPSWDPNNAQKPTIIEAKTEPKSQALLDAEERAKQLKTDD